VKFRRAFAYVVFAFLLLSQQLGVTHAVTHIASDAGSGSLDKKQLPIELQCKQCLAFAALGSGLVGSPPSVIHPHAVTDTVIPAPPAKLLPAALRAFNSRAPPSPV
jgi:hypothetical protein